MKETSTLEDSLLDSFVSSGAIPKNHITIGFSNVISQNKQYASLFKHKCLPTQGWNDFQIQSLLILLSSLDTNDHETSIGHNSGKHDGLSWNAKWCGVGEREGRVYSNLVASRHFGLSHGIGRSGEITEAQPKAVGSSIISELTRYLVLDAMKRVCGLNAKSGRKIGGPAKNCIVLPLCTGMSMSLVLSSLRKPLPVDESQIKDIVLWSRIDQKSCFKAISSSGFRCVVNPTKIDGDQVVTDLISMEKYLTHYGNRILAVISTTSCFAPRVPDEIDEIAKLSEKYEVAHIINNAYGLQCKQICKLINRACVVGRVDAIICSTDKNFLVPVGGAIVTSPHDTIIKQVGKVYAGRASSSPIQDLFITLLSMGINGYKNLLERRQQLLIQFQDHFSKIAMKYGQRILNCPKNTISFGMTLDQLWSKNDKIRMQNETEETSKKYSEKISLLGSMLFTRCVSGTRVVPRHQTKNIDDIGFFGFGSSNDNFPHCYLTAACAIGLSHEEMLCFFSRLDKCLRDFVSKK